MKSDFGDETNNKLVTGDIFETVTGKLSGGLSKGGILALV